MRYKRDFIRNQQFRRMVIYAKKYKDKNTVLILISINPFCKLIYQRAENMRNDDNITMIISLEL